MTAIKDEWVSPDGSLRLLCGDCLEVMKGMEEASVEAIVCDPPYGLSFMGSKWDHGIPGVPFWEAALRVAKPGAYLFAFGGTRTFHRLACAIEDAGWELRDTLMWVYGSGFPKSLDVSKAIDKAAGAERESGEWYDRYHDGGTRNNRGPRGNLFAERGANGNLRTAPATEAARQWDGWGTALKPAYEPVIMARKPLDGTVAANVLRHGTGAINVGGCRIAHNEPNTCRSRYESGLCQEQQDGTAGIGYAHKNYGKYAEESSAQAEAGRWPANLITDGSEEVRECFPETGGGHHPATRNGKSMWAGDGGGLDGNSGPEAWTAGGNAARFFAACPPDPPITIHFTDGTAYQCGDADTFTLPGDSERVLALDLVPGERIDIDGCEREVLRVTTAAACPYETGEVEEYRRLVYVAKASKADRDEGCEGLEEKSRKGQSAWIRKCNICGDTFCDPTTSKPHCGHDDFSWVEPSPRRNGHPTVKPTALLQYLSRLVTPPGGTILDPFCGSGSGGKAAYKEGFNYVGIELDEEYFAIAKARCKHELTRHPLFDQPQAHQTSLLEE